MNPVHFSTLLIEPPGIDSELLKVMLAPEKFRVTALECGAEAWNLIQESDPPDLVVMDIDLPIKGAIRIGASQLLQLMCHKPEWRDIPKIIFTSNPDADMLRLLPSKQIKALIVRPYDPRRFMGEVFSGLNCRLDQHIHEINQAHIVMARMLRDLIMTAEVSLNRSAIYPKLAAFVDYVEHHFALEEQFMSGHLYQDLENHHQSHDKMLNRANSLLHDIQSGDVETRAGDFHSLRQVILKDVDLDRDYISFLRSIRDELSQ